VLARYSDSHGRPREVLTHPGPGGSVLVIDRDATTHGDRRLVAHLAADEPPVNAALICRDYLCHRRNRRCRPLAPEDLWVAPQSEDHHHHRDLGEEEVGEDPRDRQRRAYRLLPHVEGIAIPDLRWHRLPAQGEADDPRAGAPRPLPVSLRDVVAALESYRPVRGLTARALVRHRHDTRLSTAALRVELQRLDHSPIVLNRALREAVLRAIDTQEISLSEITIRCGRCKRDERGGVQGDTSWLARRIGLRPEAGRGAPTPWVHSDVLALIARRGLGISPREVELG
jgi:hypothetical protein